jgi:hypothetical protein
MNLRLPPTADDALGKVAALLKLDRSSCIRYLVMEKARALGLPLPNRTHDTRETFVTVSKLVELEPDAPDGESVAKPGGRGRRR